MWKYVGSGVDLKTLIQGHQREICFLGRSNVGKSSLINALTQTKTLARVSKTPGRTQLINFFQNDGQILVDLPGYGYAKLSQLKRAQLKKMFRQYLAKRIQLQKVYLLVDSKVGLTELDLAMYGYLTTVNLPCLIVLTKIDKANQKERYATLKQVKNLTQDYLEVSASKKLNLEKLRKDIKDQFNL